MAGNGITGKDGDVKIGTTQIAEIMKWSWTPKINLVKYASNKTGGFKQVIGGIKEGTGSMDGAWDPANPSYTAVTEGTSLSLKLYINASQFWIVPCIIETFTNSVNIDATEIVPWSATFWSQGGWTAPVSAIMLDDSMNMAEHGISANSPNFTPIMPLQNEGETPQQAAARVSEFYKSLKYPETLEDIVKSVSARMEALKTPEGFAEMLTRAAEKATVDNADKIAEAVLYKIKDKLPAYVAEAVKNAA